MTQDEIRAEIENRGLRMIIDKEVGGKGKEVLVIYISKHGRGQKKVYLGYLSVLSKKSREQLQEKIEESEKRL
jgi:hypothetical protein